MFGLNPTPARAKVINFSSPIFNNAFTLVNRKNVQFERWEDDNKPEIYVAVDAGSTHEMSCARGVANRVVFTEMA